VDLTLRDTLVELSSRHVDSLHDLADIDRVAGRERLPQALERDENLKEPDTRQRFTRWMPS